MGTKVTVGAGRFSQFLWKWGKNIPSPRLIQCDARLNKQLNCIRKREIGSKEGHAHFTEWQAQPQCLKY